MDSVIHRINSQLAAGNVDESGGVVVIILCVQAVIAGLDIDHTICNPDRIICLQGTAAAIDRYISTGNLQVILRGYAVIGRIDSEKAGAIYRHITS